MRLQQTTDRTINIVANSGFRNFKKVLTRCFSYKKSTAPTEDCAFSIPTKITLGAIQ